MLTSDANPFIFVHIQKTAGTCLATDLVEQVPDARRLGFKHDGARDAISIIGREAWDRAFTFAFVRNPWDRLVSWWSMIDQSRSRRPTFGVRRPPESVPLLWKYALDNAHTFEEFVLRCTDEINEEPSGSKSFTRPQSSYLVDASGRNCVDFVGHFETFAEDYSFIREKLGLGPANLSRSRNRSKHKHYSTYYTTNTRDIIAERFAIDIERFGYEFESLSSESQGQRS